MKIAFILASYGISGGNNVVFEHSTRLIKMGHEVVIVVPAAAEHPSWHPEVSKIRRVNVEDAGGEHFDIAVATFWSTVFHLRKVRASRYAYFVQAIESRFFDPSERALSLVVDGTYLLPLDYITEADWIRDYLKDRFSHAARLARNGIRKEFYAIEGPSHAPRVPGKLRILVEGPTTTWFKNVPRTIEVCRQSRADEIWLLTSTEISSYPGVDRVFGKVPVDQTAAIYRSCDVLIKLSRAEGMFGPPLEMFHCGGTAITYDVTGHDMYMQDGVNSFVLPMDDEAGVIDRINRLKDDPALLERLRGRASETAAAWPAWQAASEEFEAQLQALMKDPPRPDFEAVRPMLDYLERVYVQAETDRQTLKNRSRFFLSRWARTLVRRLQGRAPTDRVSL